MRPRRSGLGGLAIVAVLVLFLGAPGSALAIRNGQPDGEWHPYVGLLTNNEFVCSGSAISPTIVITAAHCFGFSGEQVFVTFDTLGFFAENPVFVSGTWYPDPAFCIGCGGGLVGFASHDLAVVVLDQPLALAAYAALPGLGLVDTLGKTRVDLVGYGIQVREKVLDDELFTRYYAPVDLSPGKGKISADFAKVSANPGQGQGGTCFGDSGGPVLLGNVILAVNSFVTNGNCAGVTYSYRVDTQPAIDFIAQFL